jgi:hypothetical protein
MIIIILLVVAIFALVFFESSHILEEGAPAKDQDILEMLEVKKSEFYLDKSWSDNFELKSKSYDTQDIVQIKYSILFPYYINRVGVVPVWYKSAKVLNQMFKEKIAASKYKVTKRDKLGLGKN